MSGEDIANFFSAITKLAASSSTTTLKSEASDTTATSSTMSPSHAKKDYANSPTKQHNHKQNSTLPSENSSSALDENETDSNEDSLESHAKDSDENNSDESDSSDSDFGYSRTKSRLKSDESLSNRRSTGDKSSKNSKLKAQSSKKSSSSSGKKLSNGQIKSKTSNKLGAKSNKSLKQAQSTKKGRNRHSSSMNHDLDELDQSLIAKRANAQLVKEPKQCIGPECVREAYENSKYCSYECGMRLAKDRLVIYLKSSLDKYNSEPSLASKLNQTELERINVEIDSLKVTLAQLEKKHEDLDKILLRAKYAKINPNVEKEREKFIDSSETEIYCVSCGQICSERQALKHMEKCFNKVNNSF